MFSPRQVLVDAKIPFGSYVADFGCGAGEFTLQVAQLVGENGKVFAVDVQKDLVSRIAALCQERGLHNVETIWGDIETVHGSRLEDESMDYVILANVLFQAEVRTDMLREALRVLKHGGKMIIIDWRDSFNNTGPRKQDVVLQTEIANIMNDLGCTKEREIDSGKFHYGDIYTKP